MKAAPYRTRGNLSLTWGEAGQPPPLQVGEGGPQLLTGRMAKGGYMDSPLTSYGWSGSQKLLPAGGRYSQEAGRGTRGCPGGVAAAWRPRGKAREEMNLLVS